MISIIPANSIVICIRIVRVIVVGIVLVITTVVIFIMAIAGAAITAAPSAVEELQAGEVATMLSDVKSSLKTAQDLFITTIVFSLFALFLGGAAHMGHGSNSTKYEVICHWTFE